MRSLIHARKPKSAGKPSGADVPVEVDTVDLSDTIADVPLSGSATGSDADTTPIPQVTSAGPATIPEQPNPGAQNPPGKQNPKQTGLRHITADRPIFTLSVAADLLGLHPRTLRIYEEKGLVMPARTEGNRRRYSQLDIEKFQAIRLLTRGGVNLEGVRIILEMAEELSRLGSNPTAIIERNLQAGDQ